MKFLFYFHLVRHYINYSSHPQNIDASMDLESLPNELLFKIFEFLSTVDVLRALCELNVRFNHLVSNHLKNYKYINLRTASKYNLDLFWKQYLSPSVNQIISLSLSNDNNTPNQIDQFYAHGFRLYQFTSLLSLSLFYVHSSETMNEIMKDLPHLSTLTHLTFEKCYISNYSLTNVIWSLPKLIYFRANKEFDSTIALCMPTVTSSIIKYAHGFCDKASGNMIDLFRHTPNVLCLSIHIDGILSNTDLSSNITSLTKLNLLFANSAFYSLVNLLKKMPNLSHLKLETLRLSVPAQIWERLIEKHLPKLRNLQFKMNFTTGTEKDAREKQVEQLVETFRNTFWLDEHQWLVQCDWNLDNEQCSVYTLPHTFENFDIKCPIRSKWNRPPDDIRHSYDCVRRLTYSVKPYYLYECLTLSHIHFFDIEHITIELPTCNSFRYKNEQLGPSTYDNEQNCLKQLQYLLERYPRLTSLHIIEWPLTIFTLSQNIVKNVSVSELNLRCHDGNEYFYTLQQCDELSRSVLGIQCKTLTIDVEDWTCVYDLIIKMDNLQVLKVQCRYRQHNSCPVPAEENLATWLNRSIHSVFTGIKRITYQMAIDKKYLFIERS